MKWDRAGFCASTSPPRASYAETDPGGLGFSRKVDARLPGKGNSNSRGARPVHLTIMMIKWIRNSRLLIKNSFFLGCGVRPGG